MVMRAIGAAILVLAAAVFFGTTAIGIAILIGAGKEAGFLIWGYLPGLVLLVFGMSIFSTSLREGSPATPPTINTQ